MAAAGQRRGRGGTGSRWVLQFKLFPGTQSQRKVTAPTGLLLKCSEDSSHPSILFNQSKEFIRTCIHSFVRQIKYLITLQFNFLWLSVCQEPLPGRPPLSLGRGSSWAGSRAEAPAGGGAVLAGLPALTTMRHSSGSLGRRATTAVL